MVKAAVKHPAPDVDEEEIKVAEKPKAPKLAALPAVGESVLFYTRNPNRQYHGDEGPYAAMVTRVVVPPVEAKDVPPRISLVVFPEGDLTANSYAMADILGYADDKHDAQDWWQYPA